MHAVMGEPRSRQQHSGSSSSGAGHDKSERYTETNDAC
jgi:hypothetical protein